jgi:hypothetical protein
MYLLKITPIRVLIFCEAFYVYSQLARGVPNKILFFSNLLSLVILVYIAIKIKAANKLESNDEDHGSY